MIFIIVGISTCSLRFLIGLRLHQFAYCLRFDGRMFYVAFRGLFTLKAAKVWLHCWTYLDGQKAMQLHHVNSETYISYVSFKAKSEILTISDQLSLLQPMQQKLSFAEIYFYHEGILCFGHIFSENRFAAWVARVHWLLDFAFCARECQNFPKFYRKLAVLEDICCHVA